MNNSTRLSQHSANLQNPEPGPEGPTPRVVTCGDCGVEEGELHLPGCDMERCAQCGGQYISCGHYGSVEKRLPYIDYPNICAKCGELWPNLFMVPGHVWRYYIQPDMRGELICRACFEGIREAIDTFQGAPPFGEYHTRTSEEIRADFEKRMAELARNGEV